MKTYRAITRDGDGIKTRVFTTAASEQEARENILARDIQKDAEIIDIKENGPAVNQLTAEQRAVCALLCYYRYFEFTNRPNATPEGIATTRGAINAAEHACSMFNVPPETIFQIENHRQPNEKD